MGPSLHLLLLGAASSLLLQRPTDGDGASGEPRLSNLRRLTDVGSNAEAYWSPDGDWLIFQSTRPPYECDQIFRMRADGTGLELLSTGRGRTTCGWFFPGGRRFLYASTHLDGDACPPVPPRSRDVKKYVWPLHASYDLFAADLDRPGELRRLTETPGYDAEATISPDGSRIVFTSTRDGDIEIYTMASDGSDVRRLTRSKGYDGGAVFSPDGSRILFRADELSDPGEIEEFDALLADGLVRPTRVEIYTMKADGSDRRRVTSNGAANFAPCWLPDGRRILFSSNLGDPTGRRFDLYSIDEEGKDLERVTAEGTFNCFPMFAPDGKRLVFISNRFVAEGMRAYDICVADWKE